MTYFDIKVRYARRIPDPVFEGLRRYVFVVPVNDLPKDLPTDANARSQKLNTRVAREVNESLFNIDCVAGTFHLKNNGITILAAKVLRSSKDEQKYRLEFDEGHGIVDGAHTYKTIIEAQNADVKPPDAQFVSIDVLTGIRSDWIADISAGRNTTVQVARMSIENLKKGFEWMKDELRGEPYFDEIGWEENDSGEFDARDLIALLSMFNIDLYPNEGDSHPTSAYSAKEQILKRFQNDRSSFVSMRPILKDILVLHDTIRCDYREIWNSQPNKNSRAGRWAISEKTRKSGELWNFMFTGKSSECRLVNGALYPILAAFRWFVEKSPDTGLVYWRNGFDAVLDAWAKCSVPLLTVTNEKSREVGHRPNAVGKSAAHWRSLHQLVAMRDLQRK